MQRGPGATCACKRSVQKRRFVRGAEPEHAEFSSLLAVGQGLIGKVYVAKM